MLKFGGDDSCKIVEKRSENTLIYTYYSFFFFFKNHNTRNIVELKKYMYTKYLFDNIDFFFNIINLLTIGNTIKYIMQKKKKSYEM